MSRNNSTFNTQNSKLIKRIFLSPPHMGGEEMRFVQEAFEIRRLRRLAQINGREKAQKAQRDSRQMSEVRGQKGQTEKRN